MAWSIRSCAPGTTPYARWWPASSAGRWTIARRGFARKASWVAPRMDARDLIGKRHDGIDAFAEHAAPLELAGNHANAVRLLGMPRRREVLGHEVVINDEHVTV